MSNLINISYAFGQQCRGPLERAFLLLERTMNSIDEEVEKLQEHPPRSAAMKHLLRLSAYGRNARQQQINIALALEALDMVTVRRSLITVKSVRTDIYAEKRRTTQDTV